MQTLIEGKVYVRCECCNAFATLTNAAILDWDWFTGSLPWTKHYCRRHKRSDEREQEFAKSRERRTP